MTIFHYYIHSTLLISTVAQSEGKMGLSLLGESPCVRYIIIILYTRTLCTMSCKLCGGGRIAE